MKSRPPNVIARLAEGKLFAQYREAFLAATGLSLMIVSGDDENWVPCEGGTNENPFCKAINAKKHVCAACIEAAKQLRSSLPCPTPNSITCFAGFKETAVPVRLGTERFAFLKTGEVFNKAPTEAGFDQVIETLLPLGYSKDELADLRDTYFASPVVEAPRYEGVVALLATFAEHLELHVEELMLIENDSEPTSVTRAKSYIRDNLDSPIHLPQVAAHSGVSQHHFSRLFKSSTGMSFTEYVARCRIELAKTELLKPYARVTEIAFDVGFQSLSQFNRSFSRVVGETPTSYRRRKLGR